jgi:hypothetical protein
MFHHPGAAPDRGATAESQRQAERPAPQSSTAAAKPTVLRGWRVEAPAPQAHLQSSL